MAFSMVSIELARTWQILPSPGECFLESLSADLRGAGEYPLAAFFGLGLLAVYERGERGPDRASQVQSACDQQGQSEQKCRECHARTRRQGN